MFISFSWFSSNFPLLTFSLESSLSPHLVNDRNCLDTILYILRASYNNSSTASSSLGINVHSQTSNSDEDHWEDPIWPQDLPIQPFFTQQFVYKILGMDWPMSNCVLYSLKKNKFRCTESTLNTGHFVFVTQISWLCNLRKAKTFMYLCWKRLLI